MQGLPEMQVADEISLDEIIGELDRDHEGELPAEAFRAAQRRREEIAPRLIELIRKATQAVREGGGPQGSGPLFAFYLLAEFQAREALPAILEAVSLPGEGPFEMFFDAITEDLNRVLAVLSDDPAEVADQLIANRSLNESVRWNAAGTYKHLVRDGRLTRDQAVQRLHEHLRRAIEDRDQEGITGLVPTLAVFAPQEALADIEEAYRLELANPLLITLDEIREGIADGEHWVRRESERCRPARVLDALEELSNWASFRPRSPARKASTTSATPTETGSAESPGGHWRDGAIPQPPETIRNLDPKVGRNDPCPCGSGKKFKKCCAGR